MSLVDFEWKLRMKNQRIDYLHSQGRISKEEYEKWILSEDINFEPKVFTEGEMKEEINKIWKVAMSQPMQLVPSPETTNELLSKVLVKLDEVIDVLHEIRKK